MDKVSAILVAGGKGIRFGGETPKQFVKLNGKSIALYSLDVLLSHPDIFEIIVVCDPEFQHVFAKDHAKPIKFAEPGERRQDSVLNGLKKVDSHSQWVCVHDSARPFIDYALLDKVLDAGKQFGAATLSVPLKFTIKKANKEKLVQETPDRSFYHEIQTPQVIKLNVIQEGFALVELKKLTVTDDVSLAEIVHHPVKLVEGSYRNIKITTIDDLYMAEQYLKS
jgi:2-C-methyl-D-erythritol 4-phosphate cytidylyltransferase